jgi:hypothetical protein
MSEKLLGWILEIEGYIRFQKRGLALSNLTQTHSNPPLIPNLPTPVNNFLPIFKNFPKTLFDIFACI